MIFDRSCLLTTECALVRTLIMVNILGLQILETALFKTVFNCFTSVPLVIMTENSTKQIFFFKEKRKRIKDNKFFILFKTF